MKHTPPRGPFFNSSLRSGAALFLALLMVVPAQGQMVTGSGMEDFGKSFEHLRPRAGPCSRPRAAWARTRCGRARRPPSRSSSSRASPTRARSRCDVIQYGTKGKPGDWWKPVVFKIADTSSTTVDVDLPAEGGFVTVKPQHRRRLRRLRAHPRPRRARPRLRGDLRSRARAGAGPRLAADLRDGPRLAARDVAGGLQRLQAARREGRAHRRRLQHHSRRARGLGDGERPHAAADGGLRRHPARAAAARARTALAERETVR